MSLVDRVAEWPKPYIEQGISVGREQGISATGVELLREITRH